jgi:cell wall assembly regulator SMI1
MKPTWQALKAEFHRIVPEKTTSFNSPATEQELQNLETNLGCILPDDFKNYLRVFNGQIDHNPLVAYHSFLSTSNLLAHWQMLMDIFGNEPAIAHVKENKVKPVLWLAKWIPFAKNEDGSSQLCIDLNPGKNGVYGQIILLHFGQDLTLDDVVISNSFAEFSHELLHRLQTEQYTLEEGDINFDDYWV